MFFFIFPYQVLISFNIKIFFLAISTKLDMYFIYSDWNFDIIGCLVVCLRQASELLSHVRLRFLLCHLNSTIIVNFDIIKGMPLIPTVSLLTFCSSSLSYPTEVVQVDLDLQPLVQQPFEKMMTLN